jgi:hypothetical protein
MRPPPSIWRSARWLVGPAAIALLLLFSGGEKGGRRLALSSGKGPAAAQELPRRSFPVHWRGGDPQIAVAPAAGVNAFIEVNADDHSDGLRDDPGYSLAWHRQQRLIIERQYGHAIASLNLPEAEAEQLSELLTERREAIIDGRDAAQQLGIVGPEANLAVKQSIDADTDEIKKLIGDEAYYGRIELAPTISTCKAFLEGSMGTDLASGGNPLSADQLYSLAADYVGAVYSPAASLGPQDPDPATGLAPQYQAFLDKVSSRLTPDQVSAFRAFFVKQTESARIAGNLSG